MWNVFDTAFIVIITLYLILRWKGLASGDSEFHLPPTSEATYPVESLFNIASTSDLGFDILSCGACILFPRSDSNPILFRCRLTTLH